MKGSFVFALLLAAASAFASGWQLKVPYQPNSSTSWKVVVKAKIDGADHEVQFKHTLVVKSISGNQIKGKESWTDLVFDGNPDQDQDATWDVSLAPNGTILQAGSSGDYVKMLCSFLIPYPGKEVKPGDHWNATFKPSKEDKEITADYQVIEMTKVGETDALKVLCKLSGDGPFRASNIYWIGKDGSLLKFELDLSNWTVPLSGPQPFDAKVSGTIMRSKSLAKG